MHKSPFRALFCYSWLMKMKSKLPVPGIAGLALILALGLTYITRFALPREEITLHEQCVIEDCRSSVQRAGFPLPGYDISRLAGLNCNAQAPYHDYCRIEELKRPYFLLFNFLIYACALGAIFMLVRKVRRKA